LLVVVRPFIIVLLLLVLQHELVLVQPLVVCQRGCVKCGSGGASDHRRRVVRWGVALAVMVGRRADGNRHWLLHIRRDKLLLHHHIDLLLLRQVNIFLRLLGVTSRATILHRAVYTTDRRREVFLILAFLGIHHVAGLKFELGAEYDGEAVGAPRFIDAGNACAHAPFIHLVAECVRFRLEKAELLGCEYAMAARRVNVRDARVDDGRF